MHKATDLRKNIHRAPDTTLTLFNESGESYLAGALTALIHTNKGLTLRYQLTEPFSHALPFTYAMVHSGKDVWNIVSIAPIDNGIEGTEVEVHV